MEILLNLTAQLAHNVIHSRCSKILISSLLLLNCHSSPLALQVLTLETFHLVTELASVTLATLELSLDLRFCLLFCTNKWVSLHYMKIPQTSPKPKASYLRLSRATTPLCLKSAIGDTEKNGHGCTPIKFYLWTLKFESQVISMHHKASFFWFSP